MYKLPLFQLVSGFYLLIQSLHYLKGERGYGLPLNLFMPTLHVKYPERIKIECIISELAQRKRE